MNDHVSIFFQLIYLFIYFILLYCSSGFTSSDLSHDLWKIDLPGGGFIEKPGSEAYSTQNQPLSRRTQSDEFTTPEVSVNSNLNQCVKY